ncbi:head-tail connector protein [Wolbachia endosymbiont of Folsomia candida]|uniref:head-tail connector protein n=1 Tax=Wolbachia endosymbiont of Folsomia candida TaxID=169402 RepID=UPI000ACD33B9|nr:head-tail connector protein [Wolbachia endosymbiont of Folsomia candida]APR98894.1 phage gp6-like head-tail connector protein [Wolbachia endosymbiont of Folsomia candida]
MSDLLRSPVIHVERKSKPESFPVTLEEVKSFLRIENDQDDKLISSLIFGATDYAEWHMGKSLVKQTWQISCEDYVPRRLYLSYGPVREIISATTKEKRSLNYYFSDIGSYIEFHNCLNTKRVDVIYEAGYENIPEQIKLGIMQHVSDVYRNRSEVNSNLSGIKEVYSPFRTLKVVL